jgi:hypothetical protein
MPALYYGDFLHARRDVGMPDLHPLGLISSDGQPFDGRIARALQCRRSEARSCVRQDLDRQRGCPLQRR